MGQTTIQRPHLIHFVLSTPFGEAGSMAPVGQRRAHAPQAVHFFDAVGQIGIPPGTL